jgi:hypothetical protein
MTTQHFRVERDPVPGSIPPRYRILVAPLAPDTDLRTVEFEATAFMVAALAAKISITNEDEAIGVRWDFTQSGTGMERVLLLARAVADLLMENPLAVAHMLELADRIAIVDSRK